MKRSLYFALCGALLVLAGTGPAYAYRTITVVNDTNALAHVDIIFHSALCSDDRFTLAAGRTWSKYSGICLIKSFTAWIADANGQGHACRPDHVSGTEYRVVVNRNPARGYCTVKTTL